MSFFGASRRVFDLSLGETFVLRGYHTIPVSLGAR